MTPHDDHPPAPTKIVCVGRNYAAHARELGNEVPVRPLVFLKPPSALVSDGQPIVLREESERIEHEGEIALEIGRRCSRVPAGEAADVVRGIRALNDVTARDLQRSDGQWTRAKGFDTFCPVGPLASVAPEEWTSLEILCRVNGEVRQHGFTRDLVFDFGTLIAYISQIMTLEPGDLIATGTPEGVGPLHRDDIVEVEIPGFSAVRNPIQTTETTV